MAINEPMQSLLDHAPPAPRSLRASLQMPIDSNAVRLRDRYIATRFVRFAEPGASFSSTEDVMGWARQLLDDEQPRLAIELLHLALQEYPEQSRLWLFLLELAFLGEDAVLFAELAGLYKERFSNGSGHDGAGEASPSTLTTLSIIDAMGHDIAPQDPRYAHVRHKGEKFMLPNWSIPDSIERDEPRQKKLHRALVEAMMFHLSR